MEGRGFRVQWFRDQGLEKPTLGERDYIGFGERWKRAWKHYRNFGLRVSSYSENQHSASNHKFSLRYTFGISNRPQNHTCKVPGKLWSSTEVD